MYNHAEYSRAWTKENTDLIQIHSRKHENIPARIEVQIKREMAKSRQGYIIASVLKALERDEKEMD